MDDIQQRFCAIVDAGVAKSRHTLVIFGIAFGTTELAQPRRYVAVHMFKKAESDAGCRELSARIRPPCFTTSSTRPQIKELVDDMPDELKYLGNSDERSAYPQTQLTSDVTHQRCYLVLRALACHQHLKIVTLAYIKLLLSAYPTLVGITYIRWLSAPCHSPVSIPRSGRCRLTCRLAASQTPMPLPTRSSCSNNLSP